ncbi:stage V sporulation protein AB [Anaerocolumna sedimenticola]|uniref:Stage V sporulation protein AB n=1 Tax=Anaerocolumna sedimenticola TaxID=2696063 RepID=A0A6P1TGW3_9FIRM|nr:stage V sporulation protein AB [Anaerocolumna sedimenticola]QHQ59537.1 stage V sporulation protein AB [Anaerocolumna sedimenticola]
MFYKYGLLIFIGVTAGIIVAAGIFTFITLIGVLTRLAVRTNTANRINLYEDLVVLGAGIGNVVLLFKINIPFGMVGLIMFGLFSGGFVGCLAVALEEVLQVFPVLTYRIKLKFGIPIIVLSLAIGKGLGSFYQLFFSD